MQVAAMKTAHDLIILGSGSTAFAAALRATSYGAQVLMFEKSMLGGTCINWGCIPSKTLIHAALFKHEAFLGSQLGVDNASDEQAVNATRLSKHREEVVATLRQERYLDVLNNMPGLTLVKGTARFIDSHTVECDGQRYSAKRFLIAVGGKPRILDLPGIDTCPYLTSQSALLLKTVPASMVIIGGGVIAVELGQMYQRLGCQVTMLVHGPRLLPAIEQELTQSLQEVLEQEGITIVTDISFKALERRDGMTVVCTEVQGQQRSFSAEQLLLAVGTVPATTDIGLEAAGVAVDAKGFVITDLQMRSSVHGIWAAGDAVGKMMLATVGAKEGIIAADDMFNPGCRCAMDYLAAPMAIFTDPEIAMVGYSEESAGAAGFDCVVNCMPVSAIPKAHVTGMTSGVIKMIADRATGRILGVHLLCQRGADLINEAALALHMHATVADLASTMHVYPSIGEGLKLCAQGFDRDISLLSCCAE